MLEASSRVKMLRVVVFSVPGKISSTLRAVGGPHRPCLELFLETLVRLCGLDPLFSKQGRCELFVSQSGTKQLRRRGPLDACGRRLPCPWALSVGDGAAGAALGSLHLAAMAKLARASSCLGPLVTHSELGHSCLS